MSVPSESTANENAFWSGAANASRQKATTHPDATKLVRVSGAVGSCKCSMCGTSVDQPDLFCRHCGCRFTSCEYTIEE